MNNEIKTVSQLPRVGIRMKVLVELKSQTHMTLDFCFFFFLVCFLRRFDPTRGHRCCGPRFQLTLALSGGDGSDAEKHTAPYSGGVMNVTKSSQ